jgi:thymidylate synthase (FAD)
LVQLRVISLKVEYIDHMGTDLTVVNAARVSMNKHHETFEDNDKGLIRYLAKHDHWTPSSHAQITLREHVPIFVARQRFKHMVGFTYNEVSRRYVDTPPELFQPTVWRKRAESVKQGSSSEEVPVNPVFLKECYDKILFTYETLLRIGVCPEQARMVLPQSMYTSYYVTGSLPAFARAYRLRSDPHAQSEIRDVAAEWDRLIRPLFPVSWEALVG